MSDIKSLHFKTELTILFQVGFRFVTFLTWVVQHAYYLN